MVHFLACTPSFTYQSGLDMCGPTCEEHYDAVLKDIAVCSNGHYRLADHLWDTEVSPYFFYGDSDIMGAIREGYELHLKRNKRPMQALPCPRAPEAPAAHPLFARLPQVLASRALHVLIAQALCGAKFREDDDDREPSAQVFVQPCLHVLYLCLTSEAVCPRDEVDAVVVKEALRSVNGTCTVAVLCGIYANYSENKALTAAILHFLTARSPECRAVAEVAFAALGVKDFSFDASTDPSFSSPSATSPPSSSCEPDTKEKARAAERKKCQANALSKLRAKQNAFIEKQAKLMKNSEGDDKDEDTPAHSNTNEREEKEEEDGCDSDSNVCVFCHGHEGTLYWIGYAQTSDLLCRVDEVSKDALTLSNSNEDVPLRGRGNNVLDFLGRGLRSGTYVQRCKHRAHKECFERYRVADNFRSVGAIDRETLQYSCPVCFCLSNVLIPPPTTTISDTDSDNNDDDLSFFIPLCYAENREANIYPDQELFYVVCRSLAYTAASYELAARSTGPIAAYLTPERRGILAALLAKARSTLPLLEDPSTKHPHSCCSPREPLSPG